LLEVWKSLEKLNQLQASIVIFIEELNEEYIESDPNSMELPNQGGSLDEITEEARSLTKIFSSTTALQDCQNEKAT
jgi:hypothetical protein